MKLTLIAVAALALSVGAHADTSFDLGTVAGTLPVGNTTFFGSFTDTYSFSVASASTATAVALNTSYLILPSGPSLGKISLFAASLDSTPLVLDVSHDTSSGVYDLVVQTLHTLSPIPMLAGAHTLTFVGSGDATSGSYTGSLTVTAVSDPVTTVPEPETYALMLAGLGAVGFLARRRRQPA